VSDPEVDSGSLHDPLIRNTFRYASYLVTRSLDPTGTGQTRWAVRWKPALNPFAVTFADRMPPPRKDDHGTATYTVDRTVPGWE
jgi:hypothetical protein